MARRWLLRVNEVLSSFDPEVVAIPGWSSPAALRALQWCIRHSIPSVVMSESQAIDEVRRPLKERVKRRCLRAFGAALVGGRSHRDYAVQLGMSPDRIFLGYDAVDNEYFAQGAATARSGQCSTTSPHPNPLPIARPHPLPLSRRERGVIGSPLPPGEGQGVRARFSPLPPGEGQGVRAGFSPLPPGEGQGVRARFSPLPPGEGQGVRARFSPLPPGEGQGVRAVFSRRAMGTGTPAEALAPGPLLSQPRIVHPQTS